MSLWRATVEKLLWFVTIVSRLLSKVVKAVRNDLKTIMITGMGLFTDAYDFFCIPPVLRLIGRVHYENVDDPKLRYQVPIYVTSAMVATALLGSVIGQLVFGYLGDRIGRRTMYGISLLMMVLSSLACGFSFCQTPTCVLVNLGFFRFLLGMGIGGDYPLTATIMSEFAKRSMRGAFIAAVFSMQGLGILVSSVVTMGVCSVFNVASHYPSHDKTPKEADYAWRIIVMFGAIPAALTFYWRMRLPETAWYMALVQEQDVPQASNNTEDIQHVNPQLGQIAEDEEFPPIPPPSYPFFSKSFFLRHGRDLFSCAANWFLLDIIFYSVNLVQSRENKYLPKMENMNAYDDAYHVAKFQALVAICSTIPGYYVAVVIIDQIGRVKVQMIGFFIMCLALLTLGIPYSLYWRLHNNFGFLFLYGLTFFFSNCGPNTTTFIVPAELFPTRFRSTCHGISGAFGKVGAIIGVVGFLLVSYKDEQDIANGSYMMIALVILGGVAIMGMLTTYFFMPETMGRSLKENENDDKEEPCFVRGFTNPCIRQRRQPNSVIQLGKVAATAPA